MSEKLFCPDWLYDITVGITTHDYLTKEYSLEMIAKKFSEGLAEHYIEIPHQEISAPAEIVIRFMSEIKNPEFEAHVRANHFVFHTLKFDGLKGPRKLKGIFGSAFDGEKTKKYGEEKFYKKFKAYSYAVRSGTVEKAPSGWDIRKEKDLEFFGELLNKSDFSIDDLL
tara:strand:+ start:72 stop:575 length:504 start_codon:yes stop_codon:yes gene_type:complete